MCKEWNSIMEKTPIPGTSVIAYSEREGINYEVYFCQNKFNEPIWQRSGRCNMDNVTHWMNEIEEPKKHG